MALFLYPIAYATPILPYLNSFSPNPFTFIMTNYPFLLSFFHNHH